MTPSELVEKAVQIFNTANLQGTRQEVLNIIQGADFIINTQLNLIAEEEKKEASLNEPPSTSSLKELESPIDKVIKNIVEDS